MNRPFSPGEPGGGSRWIKLSGERNAASMTLPAAEPLRALLMIYPLGEERKSVHRALYETATALARDRVVVLRFDFSGCGDSSGSFREFTPEKWISEIAEADKRLRSCFPGLPVIWFGLRLSGLLLARAMQHSAVRPDGCILWAPPESGKSWVEHLMQRHRVNHMIAYGHTAETITSLIKKTASGADLDLDGYTMSPACFTAIRRLEWPETIIPGNLPALIVSTAVSASIERRIREVPGQTQYLRVRFPPFWNTVGYMDASPLIDPTRRWISALPAAGKQTGAGKAQPDCPATAAPLASIGNKGTVIDDEIVESFVDIPTKGGRLLSGILHQHRRMPPRGVVLFLHGWSGTRLGPHRMFVHAARRFCKAGFSCLRPDFRGRGDSPGETETASIESMSEDALAALDWLRDPFHPVPGGTVLLGICSGCKVALHVAAATPEDVHFMALWSPEPMGRLRHASMRRNQRLHVFKSYFLKLARPASWRKLMTGRIAGGMVAKALRQNETRSDREAVTENKALDELSRWRGMAWCLFGGSDPRTPQALQAYRDFFRANRNPARFHVVEHAGHSFYSAEWEKQVLDLTLQHLEDI